MLSRQFISKILFSTALALGAALALSACGAKKPVGNFQSVECRTLCTNGSCTQQCVGASGDYYKK